MSSNGTIKLISKPHSKSVSLIKELQHLHSQQKLNAVGDGNVGKSGVVVNVFLQLRVKKVINVIKLIKRGILKWKPKISPKLQLLHSIN